MPAMDARHLGQLFALAQLHTPSDLLQIVRHGYSITAQKKQDLLPQGIVVQKSVTVKVGPYFFLLSGLGDFHVQKAHFQSIARLFSLSAAQAKQREVNPPRLPARSTTGLAGGMVSPFLPPSYASACPLAAIILLSSGEQENHTQVAISLSLTTSLLFPVSKLRELIVAYSLRYYPRIPLVELGPLGEVHIPMQAALLSDKRPGTTPGYTTNHVSRFDQTAPPYAGVKRDTSHTLQPMAL